MPRSGIPVHPVSVVAVAALLVGFTWAAWASPSVAQEAGLPIPAEEIIRRFTAREQEFKLARNSYTFRQDVRVQELEPRGGMQYDARGNPIEYRAVMDILFDDKGRRIEKAVEGPSNRLFRFKMTAEDLEDIRNIQPFVLTTQDAPLYSLRYTGRTRVDAIDCYVFDVAPKQLKPGRRYFQGTIWVDEQALQIVKTYGKAVPDLNIGRPDENLFARFETRRRQIDGKYWFPVETFADDTLQFSPSVGGPLRLRFVIRYENYKQFVSSVTITPIAR